MVERRRARQRKIAEAKQSIEYSEAINSISDDEVALTAKEEQQILDIAESDTHAEELREDAINAKKQSEALRRAKDSVNKSVPAKTLLQKPAFGPTVASVEFHTRESFRFLLGRNARTVVDESGKRTRQASIIGLFEAASAVKRIEAGYEAKCPYATWTLVKIEEQINMFPELFESCRAEAELIRANATRIKIAPFKSNNPSEVPLDFRSSYAFHFANLLAEYDEILASLVNYKIKTLITDEKYRAFERQMGTPIRSLYRLANSWEFVGLEAVEEQNAKLQEAEHKMGVLPDDIINGKKKPKLVNSAS